MDDPLECYNAMTDKPATSDRNYFWDFWVYQWFLNDKQWYDNKMYAQRLSYEHYKSYMINDENLTNQLIQDYFEGKF
jgi:hypothetical protein